MSEERKQTAAEIEWAAAVEKAYWAGRDAQKALQGAIDANVRALMLEADFHDDAGNARAARLARYKARFVGRTSAIAFVQSALDVGIWRRLFGLR